MGHQSPKRPQARNTCIGTMETQAVRKLTQYSWSAQSAFHSDDVEVVEVFDWMADFVP